MLKPIVETKEVTHCTQCHMGHMHKHVVTLTRWVDINLVLVPGVAISVCDICGAVNQNEAVERWISTLLDERSDRDSSSKRIVEGLLILPVTRGKPN